MEQEVKKYAESLYQRSLMESARTLNTERVRALSEMAARRGNSNLPMGGSELQLIMNLYIAHIDRCMHAKLQSYQTALDEGQGSPSDQDLSQILTEVKDTQKVQIQHAAHSLNDSMRTRGTTGDITESITAASGHGHDRVLGEWKVWRERVNLNRNALARTQSSSEIEGLDDLLPLNRRKVFDDDAKPEKLTLHAPVALMMIDLDLFKQINDSFGHQVGDSVLIACAEVVRSAVQCKGKAYRYGGEELAAILKNFSVAEAIATAERIREQISRLKVDGCSRQITASIGVAVFPDCSNSVEKLVECADKALYEAKHQGRNRVIAAGGSNSTDVHTSAGTVLLRPEDRIAAVDLELRIDQGMRQTFMATVNNKSDEEVLLTKIKIACHDVVVVEHEPREQKSIAPRKPSAFSWSCNDDPCHKIRQIAGIWDRDFETLVNVELSARVLGALKICKHAIKVKVEPNSYRIWQLP